VLAAAVHQASKMAASLGYSAAFLKNRWNNRRKDVSVGYIDACGGYKASLFIIIFHILLGF
jgi:hypothetical protein